MLLLLGADTWRKGKNSLYSQHRKMLRLNLPKLEIKKIKTEHILKRRFLKRTI